MSDNNKLEREQVVLRVVVVSFVFLYICFVGNVGGISTGVFNAAVGFGSANILASMLLGVFVWRGALNKVVRRLFGIILDVVSTTVIMYYLADYGAPLFAVYLFVTIGNGFRYGINYLAVCALLSIMCFSYLSVSSSFWHGLYPIVISGIVVLTVVPSYVAVLLRRLTLEKARAEQANKEKSRFLANISHEIRTPLNAVVGFSDMLGNQVDEAKQARIVGSIKDASKSLMTLVEGVLEFSRIESGHVRIVEEVFNLYGLVHSVEGMFSMQAEQGGVRYITDMDVTLPPHVCGDVDRLRQILLNLVGNAVKFTSVGEIKVKVSNFQGEDGNKRILFEVIDTGVGIPSAMQSRIFERFRQADDSVQRRYGGTGLGTSIAKRLVDLMGGQIGLESEENKGSRFWFHIPLVEVSADQRAGSVSSDTLPGCCAVGTRLLQGALPATFGGMRVFESWRDLGGSDIDLGKCCVIMDTQTVTDAEIDDVIRQGHKAGSCLVALCGDASKHDDCLRAGFHLVIENCEQLEHVLSYAARILNTHTRDNLKDDLARFLESGKRLNVLVTDDCRLNRHVMKAMLDDMGIESDFASSGPMALEKLRSGVYDLMVLDIQMPGMSGFDVIELYRARTSEDAAIPIFVVTGDATTEIYDKCDQLGVSRFLLKPVDQEKLRYALTSLITLGGPESSSGIA